MQNETETQILEAAKKVFIRKGFAGARMQEIADEAQINKSMLHYYFRSKEFLFERIMQDSIEVMLPTFMRVISGEGSVIEKVESLVDAYIDNFLKNPHIPMFVLSEISQNRTGFLDKMKLNMKAIDQPNGFLKQIMSEQEQGIIKQMPPNQILINTVSLIIFPFLAKPMLMEMFDVSDDNYLVMMDKRKALIKSFLRDALLS